VHPYWPGFGGPQSARTGGDGMNADDVDDVVDVDVDDVVGNRQYNKQCNRQRTVGPIGTNRGQ